jgi:dihydrofolate reductase
MTEHTISMIAAIGKKRELGKGNDLLWKIPDDLKRFRSITKGHPCIMGRKTFESIVSIVGHPLLNRTNIVITRDKNWSYEGVVALDTIEDAIQLAKRKPGGEEVFIIGGGEIYTLGIGYADKLYLTLIDDAKDADSFFPEYAEHFKKKISEEERTYEGLKYTWIDLERV